MKRIIVYLFVAPRDAAGGPDVIPLVSYYEWC